MKRKAGSTTFLKAVIVLFGVAVLAMCIFLVPGIADFAVKLYPEFTLIKALIIIVLYGAAVPFYIALYQAFKLLGYIDQNQAFSDIAVRVLKNIKYCAAAIIGWFVLGMPLFYLLAERDDAPGIIVIGLIIIFASMVIAVFAAVLQKLLYEAIALKSENDLTV